ncbi:hypothetical protein [Nocardia jinanensis]|uniref:Uncharacterized protein n=1 Tax=Nocardia jinanensis TaxID=382504 RepID=A0A917VXA7_9NOCA|nr:hypothetical protein [Nocardia jinanensis]GGL27441.1 hypothetical protein GCM10011588_47810 [Nocardia jinanensis]
MSTQVLRCADAPVPIALAAQPTVQTEAVPSSELIDELLPVLAADSLPRLIVLGADAALAAVLTHLMRTERLHVEVGYVPLDQSYGAQAHDLPTGNAAAKLALEGSPTQTPLVRDDTGTVLVGRAKITGPDGTQLTGEAYVDDTRLFSGSVRAMFVTPTLELPGVRASYPRRFRRRRWTAGRAAQLGTPGAVINRDGVQSDRVVPRSTFYRHHEPWLLVR